MLDKEFFTNVFIFYIAEPYAMGGGGDIVFIDTNGKELALDYRADETPYEDIKAAFPALQGCKWNGPIPGEKTEEPEYVMYFPGSQSDLVTRVNEGWHHLYLGFGNHLVVREDKWDAFNDAISDLDKGFDILSNWIERAKQIL